MKHLERQNRWASPTVDLGESLLEVAISCPGRPRNRRVSGLHARRGAAAYGDAYQPLRKARTHDSHASRGVTFAISTALRMGDPPKTFGIGISEVTPL